VEVRAYLCTREGNLLYQEIVPFDPEDASDVFQIDRR
jgi:hypothetical protein